MSAGSAAFARSGGTMAAGVGDKGRLFIVNIERPTGSAWNARIFGWNRDNTRIVGSRLRLSRAKWRPVYLVRVLVARRSEPPQEATAWPAASIRPRSRSSGPALFGASACDAHGAPARGSLGKIIL